MIWDKAQELGRLIGQTPEYQALRRAEANLREDQDTQAKLDQIQRLVVIEMVRLHVARAHFFRVDEPIDAGRRLKSPRAEKRAVSGAGERRVRAIEIGSVG